jgi:hypothetical protein
MNPIHTLVSYFFRIYFNISLPSFPRCLKYFFIRDLTFIKLFVHFSIPVIFILFYLFICLSLLYTFHDSIRSSFISLFYFLSFRLSSFLIFILFPLSFVFFPLAFYHVSSLLFPFRTHFISSLLFCPRLLCTQASVSPRPSPQSIELCE